MEQKDYKLEIVNELLRANIHIRALAKKIDTNHMTILRKMKELFEENVVDYKEEGKNKVYFLKKTSEARVYVFMTEQYKLIQLLKKYPHLRKIVEIIQKIKKIKMVVLFGSYAKGIARKDSDVDIYIETKSKKIKQELELVDSKLSIKIGRHDKKSPLAKEIEKNHVIIKGVGEYYEKNGFFG